MRQAYLEQMSEAGPHKPAARFTESPMRARSPRTLSSRFLSSFQNSVPVHLNMSERGNGQLPLPGRSVRSKISADVWEQVKTAYASGIGLREIARHMNLSENTVLSRAQREGWTREIHSAKTLAKRNDAPAVTPLKSVAMTMQQRGERHVERMAGVSEKVVSHVESLEPGVILDQIDKVEKTDRVARRTYGLNDGEASGPNAVVNIAMLGVDPESVRIKDTSRESRVSESRALNQSYSTRISHAFRPHRITCCNHFAITCNQPMQSGGSLTRPRCAE